MTGDWTDAELTYGSLDLLGAIGSSPYHALADDMTLGSAERVIESFARLLFNGEDSRLRRRSNRVLSFGIEIEADDPLALAEAAAALEIEADKPRNTLRWKAPGANTPVSVFRTFPALELTRVFDALDEMRIKRRYTLSIPASPSAYSETPVTVDVPSGGTPAMTEVDAMSSVSGWSGRGGVAVSILGGGVLQASTPRWNTFDVYWQIDGPARTVSDYVTVDASIAIQDMTLVAGGVSYPAIGSERVGAYRRFWFKPGSGTKTLSIRWRAVWGLAGYEFAEINTTTVPLKGLPRLVPVLGSAPSEVSIRVALGGSSVCVVAGGPKLAYYKPLLKSVTVAGVSDHFGGPGGGAYSIVMYNAEPDGVTSYTVDGSDGQQAPSVVFAGPSVQSVGTFFVPPGRGGAPIDYTVSFPGSQNGFAWALPVDDDHAFAIFTGLNRDYLFLEPPTLDNPQGGAWQGNQPDGSDAVPALSKASRFQVPTVVPDVTSLYVFPENADLQLTYTPAWGGDAAL